MELSGILIDFGRSWSEMVKRGIYYRNELEKPR